MTVACPIAATAAAAPDRLAFRTVDGVLSYRQLNDRVGVVAHALAEMEVGLGDHVALRIPPGLDFPVVLWALLRLRATVVLISDGDPAGSALQRCQECGCKLIVSDDRLEAPIPVIHPQALAGGRLTASNEETLSLEATATVVFTSGSSAGPKAVVHSLGNHWYSAEGSQEIIPVSYQTHWALMIPVHHVGGLSILFRCFRFGGTVEVIDREDREPARVLSRGVTHASIVPSQLGDWLTSTDRSTLAQLDTILVGGAATPVRMLSKAVAAGWPVRITYGSTEMASQIATAGPGESSLGPGYSGRILPYREVRIENGEIFVRGKTRFLGYWRGGQLETPFDADGWFATGDLGRLDGDRLFVSGRKDNMFVSGGENIYPEEIEEAILNTGLVDAAIVVPVEHERFGARPIAFVRPLCTLESLRATLRNTLPAYKLPDDVRPLPENMDGAKPDRRELLRSGTAPGSARPTSDHGPRTTDI